MSKKVIEVESSASSLFAKVTNWLDENDWEYSSRNIDDDESIAFAPVSCRNGSWKLAIKTSQELKHIYVWSILNQFVPKEKRKDVSALMSDINYKNRIGHLSMDISDGEVRFDTSIALGDDELTDEKIQWGVDHCLERMDCYFIEIMKAMYLDSSGAESVKTEKEIVGELVDPSDTLICGGAAGVH